MPTVSATSWVIVASPVASPCSLAGRPDVAVTVYATMPVTWPKNPTASAASTSASQLRSVPRASSVAKLAPCRAMPATRVARLPARLMKRGAIVPAATAATPGAAKASPVTSGE